MSESNSRAGPARLTGSLVIVTSNSFVLAVR
jgi:hypothetical protein